MTREEDTSAQGPYFKVLLYTLFFLSAVFLVESYVLRFPEIYSTTKGITKVFAVKPRALGKVVFTAVGDYGANENTEKVLKGIFRTQPDFHIALGDFKYEDLKTEKEWCDFVLSRVGETFPFELISGNHESDGRDGDVDKFLKCLPNKIKNIEGDYGKEYSFDYPQKNPLLRFILISPDLDYREGNYAYEDGSAHQAWLREKIENARAQEIPWIIVGMHKACLSLGPKKCEAGEDLMQLLSEEKVDLILQAHDHVFERSKQLRCINLFLFDPSCISKEIEPGVFQKGEGFIIEVVGTGGAKLRDINLKDPDFAYFDAFAGAKEGTFGFLKVSLDSDELHAEFIGVGDMPVKDSFTIRK